MGSDTFLKVFQKVMVRLMCTVSSLILEQMLVSTEAREKGLDPGEGRKSSSEDSCQVCTFVYNLSIPTSVTNVNRNRQEQLRHVLYTISFLFLLCKFS